MCVQLSTIDMIRKYAVFYCLRLPFMMWLQTPVFVSWSSTSLPLFSCWSLLDIFSSLFICESLLHTIRPSSSSFTFWSSWLSRFCSSCGLITPHDDDDDGCRPASWWLCFAIFRALLSCCSTCLAGASPRRTFILATQPDPSVSCIMSFLLHLLSQYIIVVCSNARRNRSIHNLLTTRTSSCRSVFLCFSSANVHSPHLHSRRKHHQKGCITFICSFRNQAILDSFTCVGFEISWSVSHLAHEFWFPSLVFRKFVNCANMCCALWLQSNSILSSAKSQRILHIDAVTPSCFCDDCLWASPTQPPLRTTSFRYLASCSLYVVTPCCHRGLSCTVWWTTPTCDTNPR